MGNIMYTRYSDLAVRLYERPFRKLTISDHKWVTRICAADRGIAQYINFTSIFLSQAMYNAYLRKFKGCITKKPIIGDDGILYCQYPIGAPGKRKNALKKIVDIYSVKCDGFAFYAASDENVEEIRQLYGNAITDITNSAENQNYILDADEQISMEGRAFSSRHNKISRFDRTYNWTYEYITKANMDECLAINAKWYGEREKTEEIDGEQLALKIAFEHYDALGLDGGIMRIDGKAVAFGIGIPFNDEIYLDLFRKALNEYRDINTAFMQEFMKRHCRGYKYINDAEDMGIPGLRLFKSKLHPKFMIPFYTVTMKKPI